MHAITEPLVLDLVEWVASCPRPYADVMDAWRTSCPRLSIWEEAVDRGLLLRTEPVRVTPLGLRALAESGRAPALNPG